MDPVEGLLWLLQRSPNYTRALAQPGLANKVNGVAGLAHEELNNFLTDIPARHIGALGGARAGAVFGPAGAVIGAGAGSMLANAAKDTLWNNFVTPNVFNGWHAINPAEKMGLDNNPGELDTMLTQAFKYLDDRHPMHKMNQAIYNKAEPITQNATKNTKNSVLQLLNSKTTNKEGYVPRSNLREIGMQK
jgi:hypothetical protein